MKVLPLSLLRLFLLQCTMTLILTLTMQDAYAQRGGGRGGSRGGNGPGSGPVITQPSGNFLSVNQYMSQNDKINLSNKLNLLGADKLLIKAQSSSWNASLELKLNRQTISVIQLSSHSQVKQVQLPMLQLNDKLVLKVNGQAYIENIEAVKQIGPGPGHGGNNVERFPVQLHGQFTASTTLRVKQLIAQQYGRGVLQGENLEKVVLVASSARGRAQAQLLINGQTVGWSQTIPMQKTRLVFEVPGRRNIIGSQVNTIQIKIDGRAVTLNKVVVVTTEGRGGHHGGGHGQMRNVGVVVNQSFYGSQRVSLSQLIGFQRVNMNAPIRKLIIEVQGRGNVMVNGGGMRLGSITAFDRYSHGGDTIHVNGAASAQDIMMRVSGQLTIKKITIQY